MTEFDHNNGQIVHCRERSSLPTTDSCQERLLISTRLNTIYTFEDNAIIKCATVLKNCPWVICPGPQAWSSRVHPSVSDDVREICQMTPGSPGHWVITWYTITSRAPSISRRIRRREKLLLLLSPHAPHPEHITETSTHFFQGELEGGRSHLRHWKDMKLLHHFLPLLLWSTKISTLNVLLKLISPSF